MRRSIVRNKKGDLNLSINAIVVLILAITMLGLGLGFMRNMFSKTTSQFEEVGGAMKEQLIEEIESSGERLYFDKTDVTIKKGDTKEIFFGIRNDLTNPDDTVVFSMFGPDEAVTDGTGNVLSTCTSLEGGTPAPAMADDITIKKFAQRPIKGQDTAVMKMTVEVKSQATPTTWSCDVKILNPVVASDGSSDSAACDSSAGTGTASSPFTVGNLAATPPTCEEYASKQLYITVEK